MITSARPKGVDIYLSNAGQEFGTHRGCGMIVIGPRAL